MVGPGALGVTLLREKFFLNRARDGRPVKRQNLPTPKSRRVWKLTVNPKRPLLSLLGREFALGHDPGVVLASPSDNPGRCPLTQKDQPVTLGVG